MASAGVVTYTTSLIPEEELTRSSPETGAKEVKSCKVKLFNAQDQNYVAEQTILYTKSGKVELFEDYARNPQTTSQLYYYDSANRCTSVVNILGKDTVLKENYTYNTAENITDKHFTYYHEPPVEPTFLTQEYDYDTNNLLIEKRTLNHKKKVISRTHYYYSGKEHTSTRSYNKDKRMISEIQMTCDSSVLYPKYFPQLLTAICKTVTQNDTCLLIKKRYYHQNKRSNYTTEALFSSKDSILYSLIVAEGKKTTYVSTHTYNTQRKVTESIISVNGKQESKKVYVYDPSGLILIKSEEYGPKNQLYSRYKFEYEFF